ncbi:MAG: LCP family protein [Chloroflexi bacterium]|nr:LCP family protein [Chloroflexota bacterium]
MNNLLNTRRRRIGAIVVIVAVCAAVLLVAGLLLITQPSNQATADSSRNNILGQIQVVITPEATLTPQPAPTRQIIAAPTPTAVVTTALLPPEIITPQMDLTAMPLRECNECINILVLGIDQRPDDDPNLTRSDTMIILSLNTAAHTAGMLSIPRDLFVPLADGGSLDRINAAMAYGGPAYAMRTVEYNFGIQMHHYVRVNFNAVVDLVDLVGGIDVYVDQDIDDPNYPDNHYGYEPFAISAGWHHMDGATALKYARTRHASSDFTRMQRQQQIIMALRDRVLSSDAITTLLPNASQILSTLSSSIATDLSPSDIIQLILAARDVTSDNITRVTVDEHTALDWTLASGAQILIPVRERIGQLGAALYHQPTSAAGTAASDANRIAIQNGTHTQTLTGDAQTLLQDRGFIVIPVNDAQTDYANSMIFDFHASDQVAQQVATTLGLPSSAITTTADANSQVDVLVILGADYHPAQ